MLCTVCTDVVVVQTANKNRSNASAGADGRERGAAAYLRDASAVADGRRLLSTIAPGTPIPFLSRSSSVMVFWRKETSGMPQKSLSTVCSRTTLANFSAPSPMMLLNPTLHKTRVEHQTSGGADSSEKGMRQRTLAPTMLNCS